MNDRQLDMVLGYLNEGIEIDREEYINEGTKAENKDIQEKAARTINSYISTEGYGDCTFSPTYSVFQTGIFNSSKKSKDFTKSNGKEFVLTAKPRVSGQGTGTMRGGNLYGSYSSVSYSMKGVSEVGKFLKSHISEVNKLLADAIGPCKAKVGDLYHDDQYITLVITMK